MLFGGQGFVDTFVQKHAGPFVERSSSREYYSKKMRGCAIPFKSTYFSFIKSGKRWLAVTASQARSKAAAKDHRVTISAFPTDVNIEARIKPHMTRLMIENIDGNDILENKQYPIEKTFTWSSNKSGDVTVQIMLEDITLTRKYTGSCAFCKFVRDFRNGKRTFTVGDFPGYRHEFERLGVYKIEVFYQFQHRQIVPILRQLNKVDITPGRPPATIISAGRAG
jgi:type VI secretion system protein ImpL